jgi:hypothetical protein
MDLFRFRNPANPTKMQDGEFILPRTTTTWIERYRDAGEFTVVGDAYSGIRGQMPIGSFISHTDTDEIMMVETHQIKDDGVSDPVVTITGRSIEAPILENRVVGSDIVYPTVGEPVDYAINNWNTWDQAKILIENHIIASKIEHDHKSAIPYFRVATAITGSKPGTREKRTIARESVYGEVIKILDVDKLGIKVKRPRDGMIDTTFYIHRGTDLSKTVVFSWAAGDVSNADYLWSNRKLKNAAFVVGKWLQTFVDTSKTGIDRRVMKVDASDIDQAQETVPSGAARTLLIAAMKIRGQEALAKQNNVTLVSAQVNQNGQRPIFRKQYNVGDVVSVTGEFNTESKMRVTEHVEIEDDNGLLSYPTLSLLADEEEGAGFS